MKKKRGKIPEALEKAVDQLAVQATVVEADDIMTLGSILEQLETIDKLTQEDDLKPAGALSRALRTVVEKVVLAEGPEPKKALALLATGVHLIQEKISNPDSNQTTQEEKAFWESLAPLAPEVKPALSTEKETKKSLPISNRTWTCATISSPKAWSICKPSNSRSSTWNNLRRTRIASIPSSVPFIPSKGSRGFLT
jgi:hypothetical protein